MKHIKEVFSLQSMPFEEHQVVKFLLDHFCKKDCIIDIDDSCNLYITKGSGSYVSVVAHMDTVQPKFYDDKTVIIEEGIVYAMDLSTVQQIDLGGDDYCGIIIALNLFEKFDNIKLAFFVAEEIGCVGSCEANKEFFDDVSIVLQFDRKGNKHVADSIHPYTMLSESTKKLIQPILSKYQYAFTEGIMTDVMALRAIGVTCELANIECGYYNPHTSQSYVILSHMQKAYELGLAILNECKNKTFKKHQIDKSFSNDVFADNWVLDEPQDLCIDCNSLIENPYNLFCDSCTTHYEKYMYDR